MSMPCLTQRRGVALVAALVCLAIVMALLGNMLVGTLRLSRQMHVERDRRQCELLLDAGLDRAAFQLSENQEYMGESWELPAEQVIGLGAGRVTIEVSREADRAPQIRVIAEYPAGSEISIRRSRTAALQTITESKE